MPYRSVAIYFMSGTGNSRRVATWLEEQASGSGAATTLAPVEGTDPEREIGTSTEDLLLLCYPTHGFTAPWHLIKVVWRLPRRRGTHAACVATRAGTAFGPVQPPGLAGTATFVVSLMLALKGYRPRAAMSVNMPSNWMSLHWGLHPRNVERISNRSRTKVERFALRLLSGRRVWWTVNNLYELSWGLALLPVSVMYLLFGRVGLAKLFFSNNACNGCGLCERSCPVGAIEMRGTEQPRPFWRYDCESCMRCMGYCPRKAIEAGHSWGLLLTALWILPVVVWFRLRGNAVVTGIRWLDIAMLSTAWLAFSYFVLIAAYAGFMRLMRIRAVNSVFTHTTFTHLYRRYHEPKTKLKMLLPPKKQSSAEDEASSSS